MIWHIFKKDLKLLWLFALAIAVLPFAIVTVHLRMDHFFEENDALSSLLLLLEIIWYFGVATLTAVLVHQDGLVGVRQDWLVRPVRRRDLLAGKLLFVVLTAQSPLFLADLAMAHLDRFAFSSSLSAAVTENIYVFLGFTLPIFALVSLTRNLAQALGGAFVLFIVLMGFETLITGWSGSPLGPTTGTGVAWIPHAERLLIYLIAAAAILGLQYFRRDTRASRSVLGGAVVLCVLTQVAPWRYAFGFEKAISGASARDPSLTFDPSLGRFHSPVSTEPVWSGAQFNRKTLRVMDKGTEIYIPLQASGLAVGSTLKIDRASAHLLAANGKDEGVINPAGDQDEFDVPNNGTSNSSLITKFEPVRIRSSIFRRIKNTPVTLQINYSATALRLASTVSLPALNGNQRISGVGWCQTELNDSRTAVEVRCLAAGKLPQCSTFLLENPATGAHNPPIHGCLDDYSPYFGRYKPPDLLMREGANLFFRDAAGLIKFPVDGSQIGSARVLMKNYVVAGHFSIRLTIPAIRLADWSSL